jgi:DNA primase
LLQNNLVVRVAEMPPGEDPDSMVRMKGREEFEKRVAAARDFFEWWIERETSAADLDSLGSKMQLAQKLAETIGRVQDPMMRGEVANRASARIGVPRADFERLLAKPGRERFSVDDAEARPQIAPPPRHDVAMLCLLALRHEEAREFLLAQDWREILAHTPDAQMLGRILESDLRPDDPASLNAFMSSLVPGEEALVSSWLMQKMPPNGLEVGQGWWNGLRQAVLRRQLQIAEGRMKLPKLTTGEAVNLQKQILDLTEQLRELSAFSSARVLDN